MGKERILKNMILMVRRGSEKEEQEVFIYLLLHSVGILHGEIHDGGFGYVCGIIYTPF